MSRFGDHRVQNPAMAISCPDDGREAPRATTLLFHASLETSAGKQTNFREKICSLAMNPLKSKAGQFINASAPHRWSKQLFSLSMKRAPRRRSPPRDAAVFCATGPPRNRHGPGGSSSDKALHGRTEIYLVRPTANSFPSSYLSSFRRGPIPFPPTGAEK